MFLNPLMIPVLGICAYSGMGKTTLLRKLIPLLAEKGIRVAVIKHAHHNFDVDIPGKDSYEMRKAGAKQVLVASNVRFALMSEDTKEDIDLTYLLQKLDDTQVDLVLVEGFKKLKLPKIELYRPEVGKPLIYKNDPNVHALACPGASISADIEVLDLDDSSQIVDFILRFMHKREVVVSQGLSVKDAKEKILDKVIQLSDSESRSLQNLNGSILARDLLSTIDVPQQTNSAMDGYAFAFNESQVEYKVVGEVLAGHSYAKELDANCAVRIMTGAPIPIGADTVVPVEHSLLNDKQHVSFTKEVRLGQNVRLAGEDLKINQVALTKGTRIQAAHIGLIASLGLVNADVYRRVRVAVFSTGDEVCEPGAALKSSCIFDSNRYTLMTMLNELGCDVTDLGIVSDDVDELTNVLLTASNSHDFILSSGGVSVGNADFIKVVLAKIGKIEFWKLDIKPGRPLAFGTIGSCMFFGLPGNPVATMVAFLQFVQPAIRKSSGELGWMPLKISALSTVKIKGSLGRTEFMRGTYSNDGGHITVSIGVSQGSGILSSMTKGNCLIEIAPDCSIILPGQVVQIYPFADVL